MQLRNYQAESIDAVKAELLEHRSTLLVLPTGAGKTIVFASLARDWPTGRVLILAHTEELINQAADKVQKVTGDAPCVEQAERRALPAVWGGGKVVVASICTLYRDARISGDVFRDPNEFGLVVFDEAHRAVKKNKMYKRVYEHFAQNPECKFLGVTATPDRTDKAGLTYFESIAHEYKLSQAIADGWLVPIEQKYGICTSIDFSRVRVVAGEFVEKDLEAVMIEEKALHEVAGAILEKCADEPTLVFAAGIHHAERLTEILRERHNVKAVCVHGGNADYACPAEWRRRRLKEFSLGMHQILVGCDVFYEGFDAPRIAHVVIAKKTKSRLRYAQAVGRGTRILPSVELDPDNAEARRAAIAASDKPHMTVIDLVGASTELELELPCVADLLLENHGAEARARAKKNAIDKGQGGESDADLAEATEQLAREEAERQKRAAVVAETKFAWQQVPAFNGRGSMPVATGGMTTSSPATKPQIEMLAKNGVDATGWTKAQAGREIDRLLRDRQTAAPSDAQRRTLDRNKLHAANREHASALIGLMVSRGWRPRQLPTARDDWGLERLPDGKYRALIVEPSMLLPVGDPFRSEGECRRFIGRMIAAEQSRLTVEAVA